MVGAAVLCVCGHASGGPVCEERLLCDAGMLDGVLSVHEACHLGLVGNELCLRTSRSTMWAQRGYLAVVLRVHWRARVPSVAVTCRMRTAARSESRLR